MAGPRAPPSPFPQKVLLEPLTESLPQSVLQSAVYLIGQRAGDTVSTPTYLASGITSALALTKEAAVLAWIVFEAGSWPTVCLGERDGWGPLGRGHCWAEWRPCKGCCGRGSSSPLLTRHAPPAFQPQHAGQPTPTCMPYLPPH